MSVLVFASPALLPRSACAAAQPPSASLCSLLSSPAAPGACVKLKPTGEAPQESHGAASAEHARPHPGETTTGILTCVAAPRGGHRSNSRAEEGSGHATHAGRPAAADEAGRAEPAGAAHAAPRARRTGRPSEQPRRGARPAGEGAARGVKRDAGARALPCGALAKLAVEGGRGPAEAREKRAEAQARRKQGASMKQR
ncbi:uncharacterized protein Tco025E_06212 [Trypanosoma conorhini]|uniref:Uncharacterized protein n=1 Tax=Trypanosoma conorhini TaxID=83891 RepID=A0A3R7N5Y3_9TRYP|nr:uncharacterized protein Tco025E_06212 [Trypanosoma conorhini]RNF13336.1 hypothetical protein Tco025E_06212 [Trypanosoma conorhini]